MCLARAGAIAFSLAWCMVSHARVHIPLFVDASNPIQQSFVRLVNLEEGPAELLVRAIDDEGMEFGPVSFSLDGHSVQHFNSDHLRDRLSSEGEVIATPGDWRLLVDSPAGGRFDARGYMRTRDGFVTAMQDTADGDCYDTGCLEVFRFVPILNPGSNERQRSLLRLINTASWGAAEVTIVGVDDNGASPGTDVRLTLQPGASRTITAADLESGAAGLTGALGDGEGKWRLEIHQEGGAIEALSLLQSPTGHLTNLSKGYYGDLHPFKDASHPAQQSFARIINLGGQRPP